MSLDAYRAKRDFGATPEPAGEAGPARAEGLAFVVQKHDATRLHYDLRLEIDGVMKSWAVTRGPSLDPADRRLAVATEDHPLDYAGFEGVIPRGQYGAGRMIVWDRGIWAPAYDIAFGLQKGHLEFTLAGDKLAGAWHLVRLPDRGEKRENWLLIKDKDAAARPGADILAERPESIVSGRRIEDLPDPRAAPRTRAARPRKPAIGPDPLPDFVPPMLAETAARPPAGEQWLHEVKFDGYRLQARIAQGAARLLTRSGLAWTDKFGGPMVDALAGLPVTQAILDGEVVVEGPTGAHDFSALQADIAEGRGDRFVFWAFDLVHLDGRDLSALPLRDRAARLASLIPETAAGPLRRSEAFAVDGATLLRHACRLGLEGILSKDAAAPYRSGRSKRWLKSKCILRGEFVIGGFVPGAADKAAVGALALGAWDSGKLRPVGRVGTGFSAATARALMARLKPLEQKRAAFDPPLPREAARGVRPVDPVLVAEVEYRAVTGDLNLRHASFVGLREDKPAAEVTFALTPTGDGPQDAPAITTRLTHPDRVLWPDAGITKQGLADHYAAVWPLIAPHIAGRPVAILRAPDGISGEMFFQKHHGRGTPAAGLTELRDPRRSSSPPLIVVDTLDGLIALAQMSAVELHPWGAPGSAPTRPDRVILDLDPGDGVDWATIVQAAHDVGAACRAAGLAPFVKTSGGKGLHIVCPLDGSADWDAVLAWSRALATAFATEEPARFVNVIGPARRKGRIFIDFLRNRLGQTAVAPYSPRARAEAGVSTPVTWPELDGLSGPVQFRLPGFAAQIAGPDPWADFSASAAPLPSA